MSERRRLKAGVEVEVDGDSVWLHVGPGAVIAFTVPRKYGGADLITEPIPEEPAGPQVGDEVTAEWLDSEWSRGRYHVVRNPDGSAASWDEEVDGTSAVEDADGTYAKSDSGDTWPILALHPVERWEEPEPTEPPLNKLKRTIETLSRVTDGHRRDMADDIQRLHHAVHVELEDRIEALEARTANILADMPWLNPNPKEVMPNAGGSRTDDDSTRDVAPPPGAEQDAPGGEEPPTLKSFWGVAPHATGGVSSVEFVRALRDEGGEEPSVEDVLEWLDAGAWRKEVNPAAARIIREQRTQIARLTEAGASLLTDIASRKIATKEDVERVAQAIWPHKGDKWDVVGRRRARRALIAMGYEISEGA